MSEPSLNPIGAAFGRTRTLPSSAHSSRARSTDGNQDATSGPDAEERRQVAAMQRRDREVRAHEQAHLSAAGKHAGGMRLTYQRGPDGRQYAVGGEVNIDLSPVAGDPQATIDKMEQVQRAALAPAQPSGQDRAVAAQAARQAAEARLELAREAPPSESVTGAPSNDLLRERLAPDSAAADRLGRYLSVTA